jgi:hypothetical protein
MKKTKSFVCWNKLLMLLISTEQHTGRRADSGISYGCNLSLINLWCECVCVCIAPISSVIVLSAHKWWWWWSLPACNNLCAIVCMELNVDYGELKIAINLLPLDTQTPPVCKAVADFCHRGAACRQFPLSRNFFHGGWYYFRLDDEHDTAEPDVMRH